MSHRPRSRSLPAFVAIAALAVAACAGGDDDSTETPAPTSGSAVPVTTAGDEPGDDTATTEPSPGTTERGVPDREDEPEVEQTECPTDALADADGPVPVTFWHSMSSVNGEVIDRFVDEYNAAQDRVVVTAAFQGTYQESFEKYVNTLRSGGELPDLVMQRDIALQQMVDSQSIVPVQACVDADGYDLTDFTGRLLDQYRIGEVLVTMPFQVSNPVLYYDGADFTAAGLDPAVAPVTFDDVVAVSQALVDSGAVEAGMALDFDAWLVEQWVSMAGAALVDHDNGRSARATEALLDSPAVIDVYAFLTTMRDRDLIITTGRGTQQSGLDKYLAVALGDAAMTIGSSASLGEIYTQIGAFPDIDLRVAPMPGPSGGGTAVGGGSLYIMNESDPAVRAAAWDFTKWLNEATQQIEWSAGTGYIPTRQSAYGDPELERLWEERPGFRVAFDQLAAAGSIPGGGGPVIGDQEGVREAIEESLEALFAGATPDDARAQAHARANEVIEDYNRRIGA